MSSLNLSGDVNRADMALRYVKVMKRRAAVATKIHPGNLTVGALGSHRAHETMTVCDWSPKYFNTQCNNKYNMKESFCIFSGIYIYKYIFKRTKLVY